MGRRWGVRLPAAVISATAILAAAVFAAPVPLAPPSTGCAGMSRWSVAATWGAAGLPRADEAITLPSGSRIQIDVDVPHLSRVTVPSGATLCFPDRPTTFSAAQIIVEGTLRAGTRERPLRSAVTIKLEGGRDGVDDYALTGQALAAIDDYNRAHADDCNAATGACVHVGSGAGTNVLLALNGGVLDLHGAPIGRTWTELAASAGHGGTVLRLREPVKWRSGDTIAIASTAQDWTQQEKGTIGSVSADGRTITLTAPLTSAHRSVETCRTRDRETRCVAERAEVGILSQNLRIVGADDAAADGFGGHVMVAGGGRIDIANAELTRMGQTGMMGRYPIHFHIAGDGGAQSSIADVSFHDDFNRQVTLHGTNGVTVSGTVSYLTLGHSFMFEDGFEVDNVLEDNLVMGSRFDPVAEQRIRPSDNAPSEFWISNPANTLIGNHAAGGDGNGLWFDFGDDNFNAGAADAAFGTVDGNAAHSHTGVAGAELASDHDTGNGIFVGGYLGRPATRTVVHGNSAWKNEAFGFWLGGLVDFVDSTAANNGIAVTLSNGAMRGGLMMGETDNTAGDPAATAALQAEGSGLLRQYHGAADYDDVWLGGYGGTDATRYMSAITDVGVGISDHPTRIRAIEFFGSGYRVYFEACPAWFRKAVTWGTCAFGPRHGGNSHVLVDLDGSIRGDGEPVTITNSAPFLRFGSEFLYRLNGHPTWGTVARGLVTPIAYEYLAFEVRAGSGEPIAMTRDSDGAVNQDSSDDGVFWTMVKTEERYRLTGVPRVFSVYGNYASSFDISMDLAEPPAKVGRGGWSEDSRVAQPRASSLSALGTDGVWWWEDGKLYVHIDIGGSDVPFGKAGDDSTLDDHGGENWSIVP